MTEEEADKLYEEWKEVVFEQSMLSDIDREPFVRDDEDVQEKDNQDFINSL